MRQHVDDAMLWKIARADYEWQAEEMFPILRAIRDKGVVLTPSGQLLEVLSLTRWPNEEV